MRRFFSSDFHLGSTLINKYAHRPYASAADALGEIINGVNSCMSKSDVLIHVGDFMLHGRDSHGTETDTGLDFTIDDYLEMLNPSVMLLAGNHDCNNACEPMAENMWLNLNQNYKHVFVSHFPSTHKFYKGPDCSKWKSGYGIVLCGHVHDSWKVAYDKVKNVFNANVGLDVWDYKPVEDVKITELLDFITNAIVPMPKDYLTSREVDAWKKDNDKALDARRELTKKNRYLKKGLTPEECARRKYEAMKMKGLI